MSLLFSLWLLQINVSQKNKKKKKFVMASKQIWIRNLFIFLCILGLRCHLKLPPLFTRISLKKKNLNFKKKIMILNSWLTQMKIHLCLIYYKLYTHTYKLCKNLLDCMYTKATFLFVVKKCACWMIHEQYARTFEIYSWWKKKRQHSKKNK